MISSLLDLSRTGHSHGVTLGHGRLRLVILVQNSVVSVELFKDWNELVAATHEITSAALIRGVLLRNRFHFLGEFTIFL